MVYLLSEVRALRALIAAELGGSGPAGVWMGGPPVVAPGESAESRSAGIVSGFVVSF